MIGAVYDLSDRGLCIGLQDSNRKWIEFYHIGNDMDHTIKHREDA
jgi:hypothetical protein